MDRHNGHTAVIRPLRDLRGVWAMIPKELADRFRPLRARVVADMVREIQREVPEYAQPLEGRFGRVLTGSVEHAVRLGFDSVGNPDVPRDDWQAWFRNAGRLEYLEGRSMDALQAAVRVGARVCWRRLSTVGQAVGVPADVLVTVADAIFGYVDEICAVALAGYAEAQAHAAGALERRRHQLMRLLLSDPPPSRSALVELAATTDWVVPERAAAVALEYRRGQPHLPQVTLSRDVLVDLESATPCLVTTDPRRRLHRLADDLDGRRVAVGPVVELSRLHHSLAAARRALELVRRGALPAVPIVWCTDHLTDLVVFDNEFLITELGNQVLAPFDGLTGKQRERLSATLLAWLQTRGGANEIAELLGVHPQTVRYRMRQLEELLGARLADPEQRLALHLALRARHLLT
ncbi:MAG: PucR family transcriptional regulator [Micromonosporaceae bacterium]